MPTAAPEYLSITDLFVDRAAKHSDKVALGVPGRDFRVSSYTFGQIELAVNLLATHYATIIPPRKKGDKTTQLVAAILAPSSQDFLINELALSRIGYTVLFLGTNNSAAAIAHLLQQTASAYLFHAQSYKAVSEEALTLLVDDYRLRLVSLADNAVYDTSAQKRNPSCVYPRALIGEEEQNLTVFIVHSSGSTGFPKPIYATHIAMLYNIYQSVSKPVFSTMPIYHNGGHSNLWRAIYAAVTLWLFPAADMPITTSNVLSILRQPEVKPKVLIAVPFVYKLLAEDREGVSRLKEFDVCIYNGSAMPTELGNKLVSEGVNLAGTYGATETGFLMSSVRDYATDKEWEYNRMGPHVVPYLRFEQRDPDTFEIVVLDGWKGKVISNRPDGSYAVSDLFARHPSRQGLWRFVGRIDDTLVLSNGEKIEPPPIELTLRGESPYVSEAIVFGTQRPLAGVIILLSETAPPKASREELLDLVAPAVIKANTIAPSHSRISNELIIFLPHGTSIPRADKGSFIRRKVYVEFQALIDGAYAALEGEGVDESAKEQVGSRDEVLHAVTKLVVDVAGASDGLSPSTDLFNFGLDSLAAGRIRNALQRRYQLGGQKLSTNFVFEHPSIDEITDNLIAMAGGATITSLTPEEQMQALVEKYRRFSVPALHNSATYPAPSLATVVLTGTTGSLGANILASLLRNSSVKRVYNLVRAKDDADAMTRVNKSMDEKGLGVASDSRVISLASDFAQERLGLSQQNYEEIRKSATVVLHNAWSVNFNLGTSSFEPHIQGAANFLKLCLESDNLASFYFASSVSSVAAWKGPDDVPEAVSDDPAVAQGMGYARSKWVTEQLCKIATQTTPIRAVVLRIGQMVGSTADGRWNETEAVSLMIKTGDTLNALPDLSENLSWLPVDSAADMIIDVVLTPPPRPHVSQVWHILQPRTVSFSSVLNGLEQAGMTFDRVSPAEWIKRLRTGPQDPTENPTIKLVEFFAGKYENLPQADAPVGKRYPLSCTKTLAASRTLRESPLVDASLVGKYVECWRSTGFLKPRA